MTQVTREKVKQTPGLDPVLPKNASRRWRSAIRVATLLALLPATLFPAPSVAQAPIAAKPRASVTPSTGPPKSLEAASPDALIRTIEYEQLERVVKGMAPSPKRDYFAGVLANRTDDIENSIVMLSRALPELEKTNPGRAAVALQSLADDYVKSYRYKDAIPAYETLLRRFSSQLDKSERRGVEDDYKTDLLLRDAPPQSISFQGTVDIPTHRNPVIDTIEAELSVNGVEASWILDTGANFSTVSASLAKRLGLQISKDAAQTQGITGAENKLHIAIIPELHLGSATVRNVVVLVLEDENLNVATGKNTRYQIHAVLGYPVFRALQRITFTKGGHFLAGPDSPSGSGGGRLYMKELTPLLECNLHARTALLSFDTGASHTVFSNRYRQEFPETLKTLKPQPFGMGGAGGLKFMKAYYLPEVTLGIGSTQARLRMVPVLNSLGTDMDQLFGNLGRDLVNPYQSFTIDFQGMRFALNGPPSEHAAAQ